MPSRIKTSSYTSYFQNYYLKHRKKIKKQSNDYYHAHKKRINARIHARYIANKNNKDFLARQLFRLARARAKNLGIPFNITENDVVVPDRCPVFGIKLKQGNGRPERSSPTLDRINSKKGYVKGNVAVISHYANARKNSTTAAEHQRIADWMRSRGAN